MANPVTEGSGALTGLTLDEDDNKDKPVVYGVYQLESQDAPNVNLQDVYGTAAMPVFEWVKTIQTGERTYTPADPFDQEMMDKYNDLVEKQGQPQGFMTPEQIGKELVAGTVSQLGQAAGRQVGAAMFDPYLAGGTITDKLTAGVGATFGDLPSQAVSSATSTAFKSIDKLAKGNVIVPELANRSVAEATGNLDLYNALKDKGSIVGEGKNAVRSFSATDVETAKNSELYSSNLTAETITANSATPTYMQKVGGRLYGTPEAAQNWGSAATAGFVNFGVQLAMGEDPVKAVKSAGASAIGTALGNALLPGIGGVVGGVLGGIVGGRVICNELMRQGIMTREQVVLDYKFTRDYLSPQHVNGYHCWAVWMVKQMRQGKFVKFWKHVAGHRANEIAYIYGKRDKPDYLGKVYRRMLEPTCWVIGSFKQSTDWSILYKQKEI